jgi:hypothetical protein
MVDLNKALEKYKNLEISKNGLLMLVNKDLKTLKVHKPVEICTNDIIVLLENYKQGNITSNDLLDWVNTIWFTDLYEYCDLQSDCIASVMNELEEADEDIDKLSSSQIKKYIHILRNNIEL